MTFSESENEGDEELETKTGPKGILSLFKRGNKKCPHCGHPVEWKRLYLGNNLWAKWLCPNCNSLLTFDGRRRSIIALVISSAALLLLIFNLIEQQYILPVLAFYALSLWLWESVKLEKMAEPVEQSAEEAEAVEETEDKD